MNQSRCVVTFTDSDRIVHEVEVWASTVYEAVGEAMREFRAGGITRDLPGLNTELSIAVHRHVDADESELPDFDTSFGKQNRRNQNACLR